MKETKTDEITDLDEKTKVADRANKNPMIPAIHIEVTQYFDDTCSQASTEIIDLQCDKQKVKII